MTKWMGYPAAEVAVITGGTLLGPAKDAPGVRFLLTDSRQLLSPDSTLFFALRTPKNDGHRYVEDLLQRGVRHFVVEDIPETCREPYPDACFVVVPDPLLALQQLAAHHRSRFALPVVGITGSNGKTVVKEWLVQLLGEKQRVVRSPKSFNSQIGVPLSVWLMDSEHELGIFEAGISRTGEMQGLQEIIRPDTGIFTNIGPAHDMGFASCREKIREKLKLFTRCHTLIHCVDHHEIVPELMQWQKLHPQVTLFGWGRGDVARLRLGSVSTMAAATHMEVYSGTEKIQLSIPFTDDASIENVLHCVAYMKYAGFPNDYILRKVAGLQPVAMRLEMKEGVNACTLINDSYNSDLHSMGIALEFMGRQTSHSKRTVILSDILQSGLPDARLYAQVDELLVSHRIDRLVGIGPGIGSQAGRFRVAAEFYPSTEAYMQRMQLSDFHDEAVLLKGARKFGFERLSQLIQRKDHQTILEIDLDALLHNLNVYRSMLAPGTRLMGVVKAFSYGSGGVEVARMLQYHQADYLAVAYADEGRQLREGGVHLPILVMNPEVSTFDTLLEHRLEPEIYGFPLLDRLQGALDRWKGKSSGDPYPVHLKIDTGMHRLGFLPSEVDKLAGVLSKSPRLRVASVFSHLAASEDPAHDEFSLRQIAVFKQLCQELEQTLGYPFVRHICNTAAISRFPAAHLDMVRLGIGLYGLGGDPSTRKLLRHVGTFRSVVSQIKYIPAGETVGYGRSGVSDAGMEVAVVPVGYADGLNRRLGKGQGRLLVGGREAPIVGNISMDMCSLDVTGMEVSEGEEVIVFGRDFPVSRMAQALQTIPYEILTSVSQRVKRVYYQE